MPTTPTGTLNAIYDPILRVIRITGIGLWSPETLDRHFKNMWGILAQARLAGDGVRVITDLRQTAGQDAGIAERIRLFTTSAYRPGDRIAIVVASSLVKMQMRQTVKHKETQIFLSYSAAETWLFAYDDAGPSCSVAEGLVGHRLSA